MAKRRVKNAGKKGGSRVIPADKLHEVLSTYSSRGLPEPVLWDLSGRFQENIPSNLVTHGHEVKMKMTKMPSGLLVGLADPKEDPSLLGAPHIILPTDAGAASVKGAMKGYDERRGPKKEEDLLRMAVPDWKMASDKDAFNAIERWEYEFSPPGRYAQDSWSSVLPSPQESKDSQREIQSQEVWHVSAAHKRPDLRPSGAMDFWTPEQIKEAQEVIADATGHEFGEHDPTFVAPVTEEGLKMLEDIFKEGVTPKRSANPKVLYVTARMKKIAAQIDRQLATLPQNAILTDRQVKQILATLSS